jgi:hypothetical protein
MPPSIIILAEPTERRSVGCGGATLGFLSLSHDQKNDACVKFFRDACVNLLRGGSSKGAIGRISACDRLTDGIDYAYF